MFGSQALETAIGLAAMFFIIATAASSITEFIARIFNKRAKDLEKSIAALLEGDNLEKLLEGKKGKAYRAEMHKVLGWLKETSVWQSAAASSGKTLWKRNLKGPSYLSAKLFADAVTELLTQHKLTPAAATTTQQPSSGGSQPPAVPAQPPAGGALSAPSSSATSSSTPPASHRGGSGATGTSGAQQPTSTVTTTLPGTPDSAAGTEGEPTWPNNLKKRLDAMVAEGRTDLVSLKAGIETWFDESMGRAEGAYKRWATLILFVVGFFLAVFLNLSTISTAAALWQDPVTREAVANSASALTADGTKTTDIKSVADAADKVESLKIPGGWSKAHRTVWVSSKTVHWYTVSTGRLSDLGGWILTAILVMLGAPFWFDLLGKLVSIRGAGSKPDPAAKDDSSATTAAATATTDTKSGVTTAKVTPVGPADKTFAESVGLIPGTPGP